MSPGRKTRKHLSRTADDAVETKRELSPDGRVVHMGRGKTASVRDVLNLAAQYRDAAVMLGGASSKPHHLPQRLLALHAIELYLDALVLAKGLDYQTVRNRQHDPSERARTAVAAGLVLRKRTLAHLVALSSSTEYLLIRHAPELLSTLSQVNRVMATLEEVSRKVPKVMKAIKGP